MNKVDFPSLRPSICFVCEQVDAPFYIDTLREWDSGPLTNLTGRKYICSNCVSTFASFCEWLSPERKSALENELEAAKMELEAIRPDAESWQALKASIADTPTVEPTRRANGSEEVADEPAPKPAAKRGRPRKAPVKAE